MGKAIEGHPGYIWSKVFDKKFAETGDAVAATDAANKAVDAFSASMARIDAGAVPAGTLPSTHNG